MINIRSSFPLSDGYLKNMVNYKYKSIDLSLMSNILQPFWCWLIIHIPTWVAPNLMTFLGLLPCLVSYLAMSYFCPTMTEAAPRWVYAFSTISLFLYQTLDALDGKQARRTQSSSPLGELFDHGCDSLTIIFITLSLISTLRSGDGIFSHFAICLMIACFYTSQCEEYVTNILFFGYVGVIEAQFATMVIYLYAFLFGTESFITPFSILGINSTFSQSFTLVIFVSAIAQMTLNMVNIYEELKKNKPKSASIFYYLSSILCILFLATIWYQRQTQLITYHAHPFYLLVGIVIANMVARIILARICAIPGSFLSSIIIPLALGTLHACFQSHTIPNLIIIYGLLIYYIFTFVIYSISVTQQLTRYLNIKCFSIEEKRKSM